MDGGLFEAALRAVRLSRGDIFGSADEQLPIGEPGDALISMVGFVGCDYRPGGTLLLGINPGGGGDTYVRTAQDARLLPMIISLREGEATPAALAAMFDQYAASMRTWNLWRIAGPVLDACGARQSEVAYLNWCPFRTRADKMPFAYAMRRARQTYLAPLVDQLAPGRIIALGKKVGEWLEKEPPGAAARYVIPRTNGDRYLSAEAMEALDALRRDADR